VIRIAAPRRAGSSTPCGEEAFIIEQRHDGAVTFTITAFSCPATLLARAAGPAVRAVQHQKRTNRRL
jgi:uncharacterized protein (UPF0548 family)